MYKKELRGEARTGAVEVTFIGSPSYYSVISMVQIRTNRRAI